jgi:CheY-like chemotaxis protein
MQSKLAELEKRLITSPQALLTSEPVSLSNSKRVLWVDDRPKNNSFYVATLEDKGIKVDIALSTEEGINKFKSLSYDFVISDMGRPEGEKAGIDLARKIRALNKDVPLFVFCGKWAAQNHREEALQAGINEITSSGTTLLSRLPI